MQEKQGVTAWVVGIVVVMMGVVTLLPDTTYAASLPEATHEFYVSDGADVLAPEVEEQILTVNRNYEQTKPKPQIVVATVESLDGLSVEEYATELFEKWEIGNADFDNGVLVLISEQEREVRIEVGYGLEGAIPDGTSGRILDNNIESLRANDYSTAVDGMFTEVSALVNKEYELSNEEMLGFTPMTVDYSATDDSYAPAFFPLAIFAVGVGINLGPKYIKNRRELKQRKQEIRERLEAKHPDRDITDADVMKIIKKQDAEKARIAKEKEEQRRYAQAEKQLIAEKGVSNVTNAMVAQRMALILAKEKHAAEQRRRRNRSSGSGGRSSSSRGGGGRSGGGGSSRGF